jgi:RNA 3'-terminal phosphate cyclase (ATP)
MITIDGAAGEGGGQILRSALTLSLFTSKPFEIENIRANRGKPGLMRQHLTAIRAACEISGATAEGMELGSMRLRFMPGTIAPGDYSFNIGTAGSTMLVLQTILLPLTLAAGPSRVVLTGGTHCRSAPSADYLQQVFLPLLRRIGHDVTLTLHRPGFEPAGGGEVEVQIVPLVQPAPLLLDHRGVLQSRQAEAVLANLPQRIADRELQVVAERLGWPADDLIRRTEQQSDGPGNCLNLTLVFDEVTEIFTAYGRVGVSADRVAHEATGEAKAYLASEAPVGPYLADQLLLPMALGAGGSFVTGKLTEHTRTNIGVIERFLDFPIAVAPEGHRLWRVSVGNRAV